MRQRALVFRQGVLFALFISTVSAVAHSQSLSDVQAGQRVQLTLRDSLRQEPILSPRQIVVGQFVRLTGDSVWIRPVGASDIGVARLAIKKARVSRGASRLRSALTLGFGLGVGFALSVAVDHIDTDREHPKRNALIAGGVGLTAGTVVGAITPFEHWRDIRK
jgi:hypothetical protein